MTFTRATSAFIAFAQNMEGNRGINGMFAVSDGTAEEYLQLAAGPVRKHIELKPGTGDADSFGLGFEGGGPYASTLVLAWASWGGKASCNVFAQRRSLRVTPLFSSHAVHMHATNFSGLAAHSSGGYASIAGHYQRDVHGLLFAWLIPDAGAGLITGPEGQVYPGIGAEPTFGRTPLPDTTDIAVWGDKTSGTWQFDAPIAASLPGMSLSSGLQFWLIEVPL